MILQKTSNNNRKNLRIQILSDPIFERVIRMVFDIRRMKTYIRKHYPKDHPLQIIQEEKDEISSVAEYLAKAEIWLKLARLKR